MRFLWHSNAPWSGTGYGVQTDLMLRSLKLMGHDPGCFAYYGLKGGKIVHDGYEVWPGSDFEPWGNDVVKAHIEQFGAKGIVTLVDLFVLDLDIWSKLPVPWIAWVPVDHEEIGYGTLERLKLVDYPVAMSHFGAQQMIEAGITQDIAVIYHAVDTDVYKPLDKAACRAELGVEQDAFVIGMVMANKGDRKQYPLQFAAIRKFIDQNPDRDIRVFIHTDPTEKMGGWDMRGLVAKTGLKGRVYSTSQYHTSIIPLPASKMAEIYNTFDVLLNCSAGEGFGVPIIEAQACGVPVVAGDYTAMKELVQYGYTVEPSARILGAHFGYQYVPSLDDIVYRLECVYRMASSDGAKAARAWVEDNCSIPVIASQWDQLLGIIENPEGDSGSRITEAVPAG